MHDIGNPGEAFIPEEDVYLTENTFVLNLTSTQRAVFATKPFETTLFGYASMFQTPVKISSSALQYSFDEKPEIVQKILDNDFIVSTRQRAEADGALKLKIDTTPLRHTMDVNSIDWPTLALSIGLPVGAIVLIVVSVIVCLLCFGCK